MHDSQLMATDIPAAISYFVFLSTSPSAKAFFTKFKKAPYAFDRSEKNL
jgi:hypothetical protein